MPTIERRRSLLWRHPGESYRARANGFAGFLLLCVAYIACFAGCGNGKPAVTVDVISPSWFAMTIPADATIVVPIEIEDRSNPNDPGAPELRPAIVASRDDFTLSVTLYRDEPDLLRFSERWRDSSMQAMSDWAPASSVEKSMLTATGTALVGGESMDLFVSLVKLRDHANVRELVCTVRDGGRRDCTTAVDTFRAP